MAKSKIKAKVDTFTGTVAGVDFVKGEGSTDDQNAINYFRRHGYTVEAPKQRQSGGKGGESKTAPKSDSTESSKAESKPAEGGKGGE